MIPITYVQIIDDPKQLVTFEKIYETYAKQMFYAARRILGDDYEAEDAVQDAFIGIARNMQTVSKICEKRDLYYYVMSAARNAALNRRSKAKFYAESIPLDSVAEVADRDVWQALCSKLDYEDLLAAIVALPDIYREVLYFHFVMELTMQETADSLELKVSTVKQRLVRGKKLLLQAMKEGGTDHVVD